METFAKPTFCPISAASSNFNPRNTQCIPAVKIIAFLELEPQLNTETNLTRQAKISIFQRSQMALFRNLPPSQCATA